MNPLRRRLLCALPGLAAGKILPAAAQHGAHPRARTAASPTVASQYVKPLAIPGKSGFFADIDATTPLHIEARYERHRLLPGNTTNIWTYTGTSGSNRIFNPTLHTRTGGTLDVTLANQLGEDTTVHWHGMLVDERNDGSGMHPVAHDGQASYRFPVTNRAGLYWYHPHPHDRTGAQIHFGMGGLVVVRDDEDDALRRELGCEWGVTEIPLVIQDKQIDDRNRIKYSMGEDDWIGNRMLVNMTPEPVLDAMTCLYRFRALNASNARTYLLAFTQGARQLPYAIIGTDGGLLDKPRIVTQCFLAPAQRLDIVIDFEKLVAGSTVMLTSLKYDPMENDGQAGADPMLEHPGAVPLGEPLDILRIELRTPVRAPRAIPSTLSSMPVTPKAAGKARKFRLHIGADGRWLINGYNFHGDMRAIRERVKRGARETWEIRNDMKSMPHPMHLHGFQFRVVERRGSPQQVRRMAVTKEGLAPQDLGWLDTVLVWPGETVRIAIDFSQPFSGTQRYMFHCHNLEHEDQGMMLNFSVEP